jgi:hypothetical protein
MRGEGGPARASDRRWRGGNQWRSGHPCNDRRCERARGFTGFDVVHVNFILLLDLDLDLPFQDIDVQPSHCDSHRRCGAAGVAEGKGVRGQTRSVRWRGVVAAGLVF